MTESLEVVVDPEVHERFPSYVAVVLVASGVANGPSDDAELRSAEEALRASGLARAADHPHIASWRAAFSAFGAKPKRYPCSAEALMARVIKGQPLPRINALVDLYNAVSVRHAVPLGGEDADRLEGPLRLCVATGDEDAEPGEVVWRDDRGVTCRRWNWRQGERTRLTESTTRAFFVFDRLDGLPLEALDAAVDDLSSLLRARWPDCRLERLTRDAPG